MTPALLWLFVPLAPLAGAVLLLLWRDRSVPWLWLSCLPALAAAIWPAPSLVMSYLWPAAAWEAPDLLSRGWLGFTALLWGCATLFASADLARDSRRLRFWLFWLMALSGNFLLVIAQDALSFYVGFTVMSMAAYGLVVHLGGPKPRRAGRIYLQLAIIGEMLLFAALVTRSYAAGGSLAFAHWQVLPVDGLTLGLLLLGFGMKMGFWPLHFWLPLAHPAAPSPASAVLSGAMIEAGVLGLWRTLPGDDPLLQQWAGPLIALGLFSAFYGMLLGLISSQVKAALAYSSVSQMGYLLVILALAWRHPEYSSMLAVLLVLFAAHHGVAKGALFLATGIHPLRPGFWLLLAVPALAISGLPLTSGGAAKAELKHWLAESDFAHLSLLFKLATAGTTLLLARALWLMRQADSTTPKEDHSLPRILPWALLSSAALIMPWLWPHFREVLHESLSWSTTWELSWPMGLAVILCLAALKLHWQVPERLRQWHTPALHVSMRLKRLLQNPPLPAIKPQLDWQQWRKRERQWNRFWNRRDTVATSTWLLCALLILALIW